MRAGGPIIGALLLLGGCATPSVILLEDEGGGNGKVAVLEAGGKPRDTVIERANQTANLRSARISMRTPRISRRDRQTLGSLPPPPITFMLYYEEGTTRIVPTSRPSLEALLAEVARRPGVEVQISGHTDRKGTDEDNDALSQQRAESILLQLVEDGIPRDQLTAVGRGERDPRVPTDDGVDEIANRRVEVVVR